MTHAPQAGHRTNWLLAALEPHLTVVELTLGRWLYEVVDPIRHAYFPHHAVVSLDGDRVEMALFRGGVPDF